MSVATWLRHFHVAGYLGVAMAWTAPVFAGAAEEYAAKAAFIYNVALFSSFANQGEGRMDMCVLGRDPFGPALKMFEGKPVGALKFAVHYPETSAEAMKHCRIVFISSSEEDNLEAIADSARAPGILTVSDIRGAARKGIMVEVGIEDRKIVFEINGESARAANIAVSSKVMRLAKAVY